MKPLLCLTFMLALLACRQLPAAPTSPVLQPIGRERLTIDFGDFQSTAELTFPTNTRGGRPTVILLHGAAPADMDYTIFSTWGKRQLLSHMFRDIAEYLTSRGYTVLRFNKHYVMSATEVDFQRYADKVDHQQLLSDAEKVLATARAHPRVDGRHIFIYGFSEGSVIGGALAARHPELAGLILQGAVTRPYRELLLDQARLVAAPYLRSFAPDGQLTRAAIAQAISGPGGRVAKGLLVTILEPSYFETGKIELNPIFDTNRDDILSIDDELLPMLDQAVDNTFVSGLGKPSAPRGALPIVTEQAPDLKLPVLILQGGNDPNTPADGAKMLEQALAAAVHGDHELKVYAGLGHGLGPAPSPIGDRFLPIARAPLDDCVAWLAAHSR